MKTNIFLSCGGTSRLRFLSLAVSLWLGLGGVFLVGASIEKADGATDPFREFFVGGIPDGVLFDGTYIWVADLLNNTVSKLQPNDGTVLGTFPTMGVTPQYLAFDGKYIWVTHYGQGGRVSKLRASDGVFIGSYYAGEYPAELVYAAGKIWIAAGDGGVVLRASDGVQLGGFGGYGGVGVTFDGENVWVTNDISNTVQKVRASDDAVLGTFDVGAGPVGVAPMTELISGSLTMGTPKLLDYCRAMARCKAVSQWGNCQPVSCLMARISGSPMPRTTR